ncbi:MAG: HD domain-containing protein [Bernardetiaceae bacterium]|nr:HD domain-containing protein [Bernardetiaceae bacterium]
MNKKKIVNDPVHGFISIPNELIFDVVNHPYFQRLRRIKQLGLTEQVYPGAIHTRFHHALGAMHLMSLALQTLRSKGHYIWEAEQEAALLAILLHDVGHGPFSHALETALLTNIPHEAVSLLMMERLNEEFDGALHLTIEMFRGSYPRRFFHQLVSSQLDMDRLDYLQRDSFFTGVQEGTISPERIIKMLDVHDDRLVVQAKGIYSIENFLVSRRLMYWQVYLHKTTVSTEQMLIQVIGRAKWLYRNGGRPFVTPALEPFFEHDVGWDEFKQNPAFLSAFAALDDYDVWGSLKFWVAHPDPVLARLSRMLLDRRLLKVRLENEKIAPAEIEERRRQVAAKWGLIPAEASYFVGYGAVTNAAYQPKDDAGIGILTKHGQVVDVAEASDLPNIKALTKIVKKYYFCYPKDI